MKEFQLTTLDDLNKVAKDILSCLPHPCIVAFYGKMGAGKTTLIKAICNQLDVIDTVTSPTFSIINEYQSRAGETIFHIDFFRIEKEAELLDLGLEEYFDRKAYCFIEWPDKGEIILPGNTQIVTIQVDEQGSRKVKLS